MNTFKDEAIKLLLLKGTATAESDWVYGWQGMYDPTDDGHSVGCHWVATEESELKEISFSAFTDTDMENEQKVLLALTHVNCQCRKLKDVTLGIEGGAMTILHDLLGIKREYKW
jgi:hypothetical protein